MRTILLVGSFAISFLCGPAHATTYADVLFTPLSYKDSSSLWVRKNPNTPLYPVSLARKNIVGCAIVETNITAQGKTSDIDIIRTVPAGKLNREVKKMVRKWQWSPTGNNPQAELKRFRLDFCIGGESIEQAQALCKKQAQYQCTD